MATIRKAAAIRTALRNLSESATFKVIEESLRKQGVSVTPQQVSNEKRKLKGSGDIDDLPV